ncbi:hypothetical protein C7W93_15120 [Glaciimonas sp. PCH181]|nr:hypothetical protein C7W93_15120 [Glaciimonas sp. PCH181]
MKWFLGALALSAAVAAAASGGNGSGLIKLLMLFFVVWLAWRFFVFLWLLFKPVRARTKHFVDPINERVDATLRNSGLGKLVSVSNRVYAGLDAAAQETQNSIDKRNDLAPTQYAPTPETHIKCPDCRELIFKDAQICRYCRCKLVPQ